MQKTGPETILGGSGAESDPQLVLHRRESVPRRAGTIREHRRGENGLNHPNQS